MRTQSAKTLAIALGALLLAGGLFFLSPLGRAGAQSAPGWQGATGGMMGGNVGAMHNQMMGQYGGDMGAMHGAMSGMMAQMPAIHQQVTTALAEKLGITAEELQAALDGGATLAQLAEEKGIEPAQLQAVMVAAMNQALTDLVEAGALDAQAAAAMRGYMAQHAGTCLTVDMSQMHGAMGGMMGNGFGN